jgi:hypothetical protein
VCVCQRVFLWDRKAYEATLARDSVDNRTIESRIMSILLAEGSEADRAAAFAATIASAPVIDMPGAPLQFPISSFRE